VISSIGIPMGFTGTRAGVTVSQRVVLGAILEEARPSVVYHGGAYGADEDFHNIIRTHERLAIRSTKIIVYPHNLPYDIAMGLIEPFEYQEKSPPLQRNRKIVSLCDVLVACPKTYTEEQRSGTWATIRYAKTIKRWTIFIWPGGDLSMENQP
jgi:predicted Rossmann fold nucleotide-binding protein DprA/Smf involved in DNA uptake